MKVGSFFLAHVAILPFFCFCLSLMPVFTQTIYGDGDATSFSRIKASIGESKRGNVYDKRIYKSKDGRLVQFYAEFFQGSSEKAAAYIDELRSDWKTCSNYDDVMNVRDQKVGKRTICEMGHDHEARKAIIYTYDDILTVISGDFMPVLKKFESETCVRSKLVSGVPCKY